MLSNLGGFDAAGLAAAISDSILEMSKSAPALVSLDAGALDRAVGSYHNIIGEALDVRRDGAGLLVSGNLTHRFVPSSATTFYAADAPDITLRFEDLTDGVFTRVTAVVPFYWFTLTR